MALLAAKRACVAGRTSMSKAYRAIRCTGMIIKLCSELPRVRGFLEAAARNLANDERLESSELMSFVDASKLLQNGW